MTQKDKIQALEEYIIRMHGQDTLNNIYFLKKVESTNKILEIADADTFEKMRMEKR